MMGTGGVRPHESTRKFNENDHEHQRNGMTCIFFCSYLDIKIWHHWDAQKKQQEGSHQQNSQNNKNKPGWWFQPLLKNIVNHLYDHPSEALQPSHVSHARSTADSKNISQSNHGGAAKASRKSDCSMPMLKLSQDFSAGDRVSSEAEVASSNVEQGGSHFSRGSGCFGIATRGSATCSNAGPDVGCHVVGT